MFLMSALPRSIDLRRVYLFAVAPSLALAPAALAQESGTLTGVVVDAESGRPVADAVVAVPARSAVARTGEDGAFALADLQVGSELLSVSRFGYSALTRLVEIDSPGTRVRLELEPSPFALEGLIVDLDGTGPLTGTVVDSEEREPIEGVVVWLASEARGATADASGSFTIPEVAYGPQLVQVRRAGYRAELIPLGFQPHQGSVEIVLQPDYAVLSALSELHSKLRGRRNMYPRIVTTHDTERLTSSGAEDVREYLYKYTLTRVVPCRGAARSFWCIDFRGDPIEPQVCIDGWLEWGGLDLLQQMGPQELHLLEVYGASGRLIRAYTHDYVERLARGVGGVIGAEATPQREGVDGLGWSSARSDVQAVMGARC